MFLVSITQAGDLAHLRRYAGSVVSLTHAGNYEPAGLTRANVEYYRQSGAQQDDVPESQAAKIRRIVATSSA